jgi:hypothetical protein
MDTSILKCGAVRRTEFFDNHLQNYTMSQRKRQQSTSYVTVLTCYIIAKSRE